MFTRIIILPFVLFVLLLLPILSSGQYYNSGQDPSRLKWRQIKTPEFRIIYPVNFEAKALKMARSLNFLYLNGTKTLQYKPKQIPFIIHNYNTIPNALTVWAPKRIEIYTTPPQDNYAQEWLRQLMIHEYRHVAQVERTNQGFTKALSWLTGEQAATMINGLFVPSWFMEGDAVCTETALSQSGRGRIPSFEMLIRTQVMQKGAFSYDKAAMGSYKTFVPDHYVLGYSLVANTRRKYGYQAWVTALDEVARKPFLITPFNRGLKKATGNKKEMLYRTTMFEMDSMWKYQDTLTSKSNFKQITFSQPNTYENYFFPQYLNDSLIVSEFTSMDKITGFVITEPGGMTKTILSPGFLSYEKFAIANMENINHGGSLSGAGNRKPEYLLAWTETINDPRWEHLKYSVIRIFDSRTSKTKALTRKSRYFAPAFSPDGRFITLVAAEPTGQSSVVVVDAENGTETGIIQTSADDFFMTPSWSEDGKKIVFTKLDSAGKSIVIYDLYSRNTITLIPSTFTEISNPVFARDFVLFNGSYSGIENIYAVKTSDLTVFQVTSAKYGANNACLNPDGTKIVYSNYSSSGYKLAEAEFEPSTWKPISEVRDYSPSLYKHLVKEEEPVITSEAPSGPTLKPEAYRKAAHIFNFHSWAPLYINYMTGDNGAGVSFMSQNELSTATTIVGYKYDPVLNTGKATADFNWQAWYPVINLSTSYGTGTGYTSGDTVERYHFNETLISGGISLPMVFTGGKYYKGLRIQVHTTLSGVTNNTSPSENKRTGSIYSLDYSMYFYRFIKQSAKDIYPRWGQVFNGIFRHTPFGTNVQGNILSATMRFYFPGLINHHGIRADLNWQSRGNGRYYFSNQILTPRGFLLPNEDEISAFSLNYKFPFAYPDFSLGPVAYIKRLKANMFFDAASAKKEGIARKFQSYGVEITSDMHFLRFIFPVDLGFRFGYKPDEKLYFANLLFSVNLSD